MSTTRSKRKAEEEDYEDRKLPAKTSKRKKTKSSGDDQSTNKIDVFANDLVATTIFSYMGVRELFAISNTSKCLRTLIRHKHVVRSALMHGGHAKKSMERIVPLVKAKSIYTPSPLRLLRICNGKRCENCNMDRVNMVNEHFGVFFCWHGCIQNKFSKKVGCNKKWKPFLFHSRVASVAYSSNGFVFTNPFKDSTGVMAGPLIHLGHMNTIIKSRGNKTIDEVLSEMDVTVDEATTKQAQDILDTNEQSTGDAKSPEKEKKEKAIETKKEAVQAVLEKLEAELGGQEGPVWKQFALNYMDAGAYSSRNKVVQMEVAFVDSLLEPYIKSPSKFKKKICTQLVEEIKETFTLLWEKGLHDFSFLSDEDEFDRTMKEHFRQKYPNLEHLRKITPGDVADLNADGDPLMLSCYAYSAWRPPLDAIVDEMEKKIVSTLSCAAEPSPKLLADFARAYFQTVLQDQQSREDCRAAFQTCMEGFPTLHQTAIEFLSSREYTDRFSSSREHTDRSRKEFWKMLQFQVPAYLLERDFDGMAEYLEAECSRRR